jgi:hypothetical protein
VATFKLKTSAAKPRLNLRLPALMGWATILGFVALVTLALLAHAGGALNYLYLVAALAVGGFLYWCYPGLYLGFTLWLWFLTPGVRRLVDYQQGWNPESPVMLAPYRVTALTFFTVLRHLPKLQLRHFFPFGLVFSSLFYGYSVGVFREGGPLAATFDLLNWLVPVLFSFHLLVHWRSYPRIYWIIQRTFVWGVLVMGLYGLLQFFYLPAWDRNWMLNAPIEAIGFPEPLQLKVFSTLNSPGSFAIVMMAGLLLLFTGRGASRWLAAGPGYATFLLSLVRSAWVGWVVGAFLLLVQIRGLRRLRLLGVGLVFLGVLLPFITLGPVADLVNERLQTFASLEEDISFRARVDAYGQQLPAAVLAFVGEGLGSTGVASGLASSGGEQGGFDSGIINTFITLGFIGTAFYAVGMTMLFVHGLPSRAYPKESLLVAYSVAISVLTQLVFGSAQVGVTGMILWGFLGLTVAGKAHAKHYPPWKEESDETTGG